MNVKWSINTGYVMNTPPYEFEIDHEELSGMSDSEIECYLYEEAQEEFHQKYGVSIDRDMTNEIISRVRAYEEELEEDN